MLHIDEATLKTVHGLWGPGKFSDILFMDGKAFRPDGNLVTYTGWGDIEYWNSFVANLEIRRKGDFSDPRLNNPEKYPIDEIIRSICRFFLMVTGWRFHKRFVHHLSPIALLSNEQLHVFDLFLLWD